MSAGVRVNLVPMSRPTTLFGRGFQVSWDTYPLGGTLIFVRYGSADRECDSSITRRQSAEMALRPNGVACSGDCRSNGYRARPAGSSQTSLRSLLVSGFRMRARIRLALEWS